MSFLTDHLDEVGESYWKHMLKAAGFAMAMLVGGVACLVHAVLPFLFVRTGSTRVRHLHEVMVENRPASGRRASDDSSGHAVDDEAAGIAAGPGSPA
ncbi:MAG: DUF6356 family protein [Gammaproteobacteria bacterium]|nr:DUF6356 family protein [Gammaproteobacteria bacterium]MDE0443523.1 DUF6356 family protein [Gammaproteobacteria bacterium]